MTAKQILYYIGLFLLLPFVFCCGERQEEEASVDRISGSYCLFTPGTDGILEGAQTRQISERMTRQELIQQLGQYLSENYFATADNDQKTEIRFDLVQIHKIQTPGQRVHIAVINMIDEHEDGLRYFFQGSYGGQVTFAMVAATFLQPQRHPPLLDGLILQYNGEPFPDLDHINFKGIVTPRSVERIVLSAFATPASDANGQQ